jgi:nitrogen fixation protein FixH
MTEVKGWHVFAIFALAFGVIIAVNLTLAFKAVSTFPGLEVKNSYVASQTFDADRAAQLGLDWDVAAHLEGNELVLAITRRGDPVEAEIENAIFGRATMVTADQTPDFRYDGTVFRAPVVADPGNWNLRLRLRAANGTLFQQRVIVRLGS